MRIIKISALALLAALLGAFLWYRYVVRTPEYIIKQLIRDTAATVSKQQGETNSVNALKILTLSRHMDQQVAFSIHDLPVSGSMGSEEFVSHITRTRMMMENIEVRVLDILIVSIEGDQAVAECEVRAFARTADRSGQGGRRWESDDLYHLRITLHKVGDQWLFSGFHESNILQK